MMRVFVAELKKLFLLFKADPKSIAAGIIAPTVILIIFALTFGNFTSLKLAFVNDDDGVYGTTLESSIFSQISPLGKNPYFEEIKTDKETAFNLYEKGKVNGVVVVGKDFSALLRDGKNTSIEYHFNNYNTDMAKNLRLYLAEGILDFYRALLVNSFSGAAVFTMASAVILWFLSGATASIKYATGILKKIALAVPNTYGLSYVRGKVFAMDSSVGGILGFKEGWMIMIGYMFFTMIFAVYIYRKKLARSVV